MIILKEKSLLSPKEIVQLIDGVYNHDVAEKTTSTGKFIGVWWFPYLQDGDMDLIFQIRSMITWSIKNENSI